MATKAIHELPPQLHTSQPGLWTPKFPLELLGTAGIHEHLPRMPLGMSLRSGETYIPIGDFDSRFDKHHLLVSQNVEDPDLYAVELMPSPELIYPTDIALKQKVAQGVASFVLNKEAGRFSRKVSVFDPDGNSVRVKNSLARDLYHPLKGAVNSAERRYQEYHDISSNGLSIWNK